MKLLLALIFSVSAFACPSDDDLSPVEFAKRLNSFISEQKKASNPHAANVKLLNCYKEVSWRMKNAQTINLAKAVRTTPRQNNQVQGGKDNVLKAIISEALTDLEAQAADKPHYLLADFIRLIELYPVAMTANSWIEDYFVTIMNKDAQSEDVNEIINLEEFYKMIKVLKPTTSTKRYNSYQRTAKRMIARFVGQYYKMTAAADSALLEEFKIITDKTIYNIVIEEFFLSKEAEYLQTGAAKQLVTRARLQTLLESLKDKVEGTYSKNTVNARMRLAHRRNHSDLY